LLSDSGREPLRPLVVISALAAVILLLKRALRRKRTQTLADAAHQLGFTFEGQEWGRNTVAPQLETPLFEGKRREAFRNIMSGSRAGLQVSFFDYSYGGGGYGRLADGMTDQTLATFSQDVWLPQFEIVPRGTLRGLGGGVFRKGIQVESHPDFSKRFRLLSVEEEKVRQLLTPSVLSFLEGFDSKSKWRLEGFGRTLVIYRPKIRVKPKEFGGFVEETTRMATTFFGLCGLKKSST
jgi:hypothetical protein